MARKPVPKKASRRSVPPARPAPKAARPAKALPKGTALLSVFLGSIEVKHNGWPPESNPETDLSLVLQVENPGGAPESRVLATDRVPFRARSGDTVTPGALSPGSNGVPFFRGPVAVSDHINLHVRFFIERSNVLGPILGAALNTVVEGLTGRIPLLPEPLKEALHIQIGKTIATELARATVIIPVGRSMEGRQPMTVALIAPRTIPGVYAPPGSPQGFKKGVIATEGELSALLHLDLELTLPT